MSIELSILSSCLVLCIGYIIQTNRTDMRQRFDDLYRQMSSDKLELVQKLHDVRDVAQRCVTQVAVLEDRDQRRRKEDPAA